MKKSQRLVDLAAAKVVKAEEKLGKAEERLRKAAAKVEARKSKLAQEAVGEIPDAPPPGEASAVQDTTRE